MTRPPLETFNGRVWFCDYCGKQSLWTSTHSWYGSWLEADEGRWERIRVSCGCKAPT